MGKELVSREQRTSLSVRERTCSLLSSNDYDWSGNAVFDESGKVQEFRKSSANNYWNVVPVPDLSDRPEVWEDKQNLDEFMSPFTKEEFAVVMVKLGNHCGMQNKSPSVVKEMLRDYWEDMGHYPGVLVEKACSHYRKLANGNEFMPSSGKLISFISGDYAKLKKMQARLNRVLRIDDQQIDRFSGLKLDFWNKM